jgi:hypothetical protein
MTAHYAKPMSCVLFRTLVRMQLPLVLAVAALLFVAWPADAGDKPCGAAYEIKRGDGLRRLLVYACGYSNDDGIAERARIRIFPQAWDHTIRVWRSSTAQTITLEHAELRHTPAPNHPVHYYFGKATSAGGSGNDTCRIGSPAGRIGCSVPNTNSVTFYSYARDFPAGHDMQSFGFSVSWRDDQGFPHADRPANAQSPPWDAK